MASIEKRGRRWCVRWREDGVNKRRSCPTKETAKQLARQIEHNLAIGVPAISTKPPSLDLVEAITAYLDWHKMRESSPRTIDRYKYILKNFALWWAERDESANMQTLALSTIEQYGGSLSRLASRTRRGYLHTISVWWRWCADRYPDRCAPWRPLDLPRATVDPLPAPTWAEMDRCIAACRVGYLQDLATVLRYTGLRYRQAIALQWADLDWQQKSIRIRAAAAKERRGRILPMHPDLEVWFRDRIGIAGTILHPDLCDSRASMWIARAWEAAQVRDRITGWHAFRRGVETGLAAAGVDLIRLKILMGHSLGVEDHYIDAAGLDLRDAIERIPTIQSEISDAAILSIRS